MKSLIILFALILFSCNNTERNLSSSLEEPVVMEYEDTQIAGGYVILRGSNGVFIRHTGNLASAYSQLYNPGDTIDYNQD